MNADFMISKYLMHLGIMPHILGYAYLRSAISKVIENPDNSRFVMTELYPTIANEFDIEPRSVETGMKRAIAKSKRPMPTRTFIAIVAEEIRLNMIE